jgi:MFS transporter, OFA family, oxalate/formate antiporter
MNEPAGSFLTNRWVQLTLGIVGMISVTNLQYGWTFFVQPIMNEHPWTKPQVQMAITIFILAETWLVPIEAYLADLFGTRLLVFAGGVLVAVAWIINSIADTLFLLYLGNALGGAGAGIVYGISIGNALRWFPDRRGLAAGLTAAAFGAGSAITVIPIQATIEQAGYQAAFFWFGIGQGAIVLLVSLAMRTPRSVAIPAAKVLQSVRDFTPWEMLRTPLFWLVYAMMTLATVGGVVAIAELEPMARSFGVAHVSYLIIGNAITTLSLAAMLDRIMGGITRPIFGWISDHIGRENTMFIAFTLEAGAIFGWITFGQTPEMFVLFSALTLFFWGEVFSLFPALCGDMFGRKFAITNYALLYTAKGTASLLIPLGSYLHQETGSWTPIFAVAIVFDGLVAFTALYILRPLRKRWSKPIGGQFG